MTGEDQERVRQMRRQIFLTAVRGGQAHLASSFSCVELLYALYGKGLLRIDREKPEDINRDRFILSKGHAGLALYTALFDAGLITKEILNTYLQPEGNLGGEPVSGSLPWIEASTGSLGHGLSVGMGMALAGKLNKQPYRVFVILGDGECEEGSIWEAVMASYRFELDHLVAIIDANGLQKMDTLKETMRIDQWRSKWEAFGWDVEEIQNGHDVDEICQVLKEVSERRNQRPHLVIAHTVKGKGVSLMENNPDWHFRMPRKKEKGIFMKELGLTQEEMEECKELT